MKGIKGKDLYSKSVLALLIIIELLGVLGRIHDHCERWQTYSLISLALLAVVVIIAEFCCHTFRCSTLNFTRLLASAIVPKPLTIAYLLGFVMHLSWMTDGVLNFLVGDPGLYPFFIGGIGILILFITFPDNRSREGRKKKVFISGLSLFPKSLNPITNKPVEYNKFNLLPLVRILQLAEDECEDCDMLILKTQNYADNIPDICIERAEELKLNVVEEDDFQHYGIKKDNALDDKLRLIIKKTAWNEFVTPVTDKQKRTEKEKWLRDSVKIHFTAPCDYDNYPECFKELSKSLIDFDTNDNMLIFNLTPGSAVISSVMTILSIDSGRDLYYYKQNDQGDIVEKLQEVDKTKIPLENLLSQALEKIKKQ